MNAKLMVIALVFGFIFLCGGCATTTRGTTQSLYINSTPTGAHVQIDGMHRGVTPITVALKRNKDHEILFTKDGHEDTTFEVRHKFVASSLGGNLLLGGLIGIVVDLCTGASYDLEPQTVMVTLDPKDKLAIKPPEKADDPANKIPQ